MGDSAAEVLEVIPAVMDALRHAMRGHVGDQLSVPQFRCLNFIAHQPGASVSAVAALLGVALPTASAMIDRLVRAGAVEPRTAADDRRRSQLHLTAAGAAQLVQIRLDARAELAQVLATRSQEELRTLHAGLAVLRKVFVTP
ncbi:MAG TPA: MarR family winged helix-turn-helix transcriptional regulator [Ideonella sp.]|uniref:MarR family winged helix-turn-helix transcriptional regulator n=1 Tax=Ideonella sp. TaxID=1929293 RepID=UPI002E3038CF|nr:MarR family winged helix-turn-helix transcriptional regulator [Ideonella sp.]HEX5683105.1 MarR family winged helix-turn-helix transcriptional regulator [Ideonella sp.]